MAAASSSFPWNYLADIYRAGAAKNSFDAVAVNPFTATSRT